jgi:hypothetical protein
MKLVIAFLLGNRDDRRGTRLLFSEQSGAGRGNAALGNAVWSSESCCVFRAAASKNGTVNATLSHAEETESSGSYDDEMIEDSPRCDLIYVR